MNIGFEEWISNQHLGATSKELFNESVLCYKTSAYKAALLFSYLGFLSIVRERLLASSPPGGFPRSKWDHLLEAIVDDEKWDTQVLTAIKTKKPSPVFLISEDLRHQVEYWKNRRNDCAHSKSNILNHAHVESFWLFIRSNLAKFVVGGSKESLLNEIMEHFDPSLTPSDSSVTHIVERIPDAIEPKDTSAFLDSVNDFFQSRGVPIFGYYSKDELKFFDSLLSVENPEAVQAYVNYIASNERLFLDLLGFNPRWVSLFSRDEKLIRSLWYKHLFSGLIDNDFEVYCALLRNSQIPESQLREANMTILRRMDARVPGNDCMRVLDASGFFQALYEYAFVTNKINDFGWGNSNRDLIIQFLDKNELDEEIASSLSKTFSKENHPFELRSALNVYLSESPDKANKLKALLEMHELQKPKYLNALFDQSQKEFTEDDIPF